MAVLVSESEPESGLVSDRADAMLKAMEELLKPQ
jgi:hypothetical protein